MQRKYMLVADKKYVIQKKDNPVFRFFNQTTTKKVRTINDIYTSYLYYTFVTVTLSIPVKTIITGGHNKLPALISLHKQ